MAERFALPATITGTTWGNVMSALWEKPARGMIATEDGAVAPSWTNREAVAVIAAARTAARSRASFPLWYQYAALAYGWEPAASRLDNTTTQADAGYDAEGAVQLQLELQRIAETLDAARVTGAELRLDGGSWDTPELQQDVLKALSQDGAHVEFKIPIPGCKDPKTGKPRLKPIKNPKTGKWECPPATIDDPVTIIVDKISKNVGPLLIILIAAAWYKKQRRRSRQRR